MDLQFSDVTEQRLLETYLACLGNLSLDWEFQQRLGKNLGN